MLTPHAATNMNFPAPLAVLAFLCAAAGVVLTLSGAGIAWFARKPKLVRLCLGTGAAGMIIYLALLFGVSLASRTHILAHTQEKYFCEIDCHLAYSLLDVAAEPSVGFTHYQVTIRTRFDETTTSPTRPKDATLAPSPRTIFLQDAAGHRYLPTAALGTPLLTPLKPGDSYTTQVTFDVPLASNPQFLCLLLTTTPQWPDLVVIGDENSFFHRKTYFAL